MFAFESECFWFVLLLAPILIAIAATLPISGNSEDERDDYTKRRY